MDALKPIRRLERGPREPLAERTRGGDPREARAYEIPTDRPGADGTLEWDSTALVVVVLAAGGKRGLGYTYADASAAHLINRTLAPLSRHGAPGLHLHVCCAARNLVHQEYLRSGRGCRRHP